MWIANLKNLIAALILSLVIICTASGDVISVNPGESIKAAIDASSNGDEIEVAPGTYNEAINFNGKAVRLYSSSGPDVTTIDANGVADANHVVKCVNSEDANTILEGFTITGGNAQGSSSPDPDFRGGGMYNESSSSTVTNCIFSGNSAYYFGGGMFNKLSNPTVTNCTFYNNTANWDGGGMFNDYSNPTVTNCTFTKSSGGGMCNSEGSNPTVSNCSFTGNSADFDGGGMKNNNSNATVTDCNFAGNWANRFGGGMVNRGGGKPTVTNCTFSDNKAGICGGGMSNEGSSPTVSNCTFNGNSANYGGGMNNNASNPTVTNCTFNNNSADSGGGMLNGSSSPVVTNCTFTGNTASSDTFGGGGMYSELSSPTVTNCTFSSNSAYHAGGGMSNNSSNSTVTNCTFIGNEADYGGGMYNRNNSSPTVTNCILWDDTSDEIVDDEGSSSTVSYSDVMGGYAGTGNIDADPCFVDANNPDPNLWNLQLQPDSPCIDAGDTTAVPAGIFTDAGGNLRGVDDPARADTGISFLGVTVDMGAYEFQVCRIAGDINCDGVVDFKDLSILCNNWLAGTEPEL
jgi:parallel beta-helix repeat protein